MSPTNPTLIDAELVHRPIQRVRIDPLGYTTSPLVDVVYLIDMLSPVRDHLANQVKGKLLEQRIKHATGQIAEAELRLQSIPRVPSARSFLRVMAAKAEADGTTLEKLLVKMESCITINKTALKEFFGEADIDALCEDCDPKLPSMVVRAVGTGPEDAGSALRQLIARERNERDLFVVPPKGKPEKKDPAAPRVAYVE